MLNRHLERQLEESRAEAETFRRRVELQSDESQRLARDKAAIVRTFSHKVLYRVVSPFSLFGIVCCNLHDNLFLLL